jgi:uncharacterized PurR-regulated membrane protein YhhQ (DUF165 family)
MSDHIYLPTQQHGYAGLPRLSPHVLHWRREAVFLVFAGLFLGTLAMLNLLGITRFIRLHEIVLNGGTPGARSIVFAVAVGVLPYPVTFLCTDFISELYGRRRANLVVWIGLLLNLWVMFILWFGGLLPGFAPIDPATGMPPPPAWDPARGAYVETGWTFYQIQRLTFGAVTASMIAYLAAQFIDVYVFHFWKRLTRNRHLWLRNNGSTLVSQLVDTTAVILITHFYAHALPVQADRPIWPQLGLFIATGYAFKAAAALLDTIPFYIGAPALARYLRLPPPHHPPTPPPAAAAVEAGVG